MKKNIILFGLVIATFVFCGASCNKKLAPGGAYAPAQFLVTTNADLTTTTNVTATAAPDLAFFAADTAFSLAYATVDGAFKWERDNRAKLFALDPDIKHTLDKIRPQAWAVNQRWAAARQAYRQNPIPANLTTFQQIVAQVQALVPAVLAAQAKVVSPAVATP